MIRPPVSAQSECEPRPVSGLLCKIGVCYAEGYWGLELGSFRYWSSSSNVTFPDPARFVFMGSGLDGSSTKTTSYCVCPVRVGQ